MVHRITISCVTVTSVEELKNDAAGSGFGRSISRGCPFRDPPKTCIPSSTRIDFRLERHTDFEYQCVVSDASILGKVCP